MENYKFVFLDHIPFQYFIYLYIGVKTNYLQTYLKFTKIGKPKFEVI